MRSNLLALFGLAAFTLASSSPDLGGPDLGGPDLEGRRAKVAVQLTSTGDTIIGSTFLGIESFRGIPFADAPTGQLRLRPPQKLSRKLGSFDATPVAPACPQMWISSNSKTLLGDVLNELLELPLLQTISGREDCLSVSVQRPAGVKKGSKLPVLFWIFGGGFQLGSTSTYDARSLLKRASDQDQDFIFVAVNYRVGGFGFMPGKEVLQDGASNLGLLDQRMGLQWVADNIADFGGDPDKVTIWGESAGAISVFDQMALYGGDANYKGKPLFRGAIMNSGSIVPADPVDCPKGQAIYDSIVREAGCSGASYTLDCLRQVDYQKFMQAVNSVPSILSYQSIALSYLPRPDGAVLPDSPEKLAAQGRYHAVPMIIGNQEDEGTLFSLFQRNITTTEKLVDYLSQLFFHNATKDQLYQLVNTYDPKPSAGSPFRTGRRNQIWPAYPGFKRMAAVLGDLSFTLARRVFLDMTTRVNPDVPSWSYLASYRYLTPIMGTFHASDLIQTFYGQLRNYAEHSTRTYYFNFLHNLDPNKGNQRFANWPQWKEANDLMWFRRRTGNDMLKDDFRQSSYKAMLELLDVLRI